MNEQELQRFIQIRDEIHREIGKIAPHVANLKEAVTTLFSQAEVFKTFSKTAQEHIKTAIEGASQDMACRTSEAFSSKIETQVQEILTTLDQSVQHARRTLNISKEAKYQKLILWSCVGCLLWGTVGAGFGYFYATQKMSSLPSDFMKMYTLGHEHQATLSKLREKEKQKRGTIIKRK